MKYLIWSTRFDGWWKKGGFTDDSADAGVYSKQFADTQVKDWNAIAVPANQVAAFEAERTKKTEVV